MGESPSPNPGQPLELDQALEAIRSLLLVGRLPGDLPESLRNHAVFQEVAGHLQALEQFAVSLSNGDLDPELAVKGRAAGALKNLQANLRHLTWQTQRIASGDLNQKVLFMGDFSAAFNAMVAALNATRQELEANAKKMADGRRAALNLMLDAQAVHQEAEAANEKLQAQMDEIQILQAKLLEQAIRDPLTGCYNRRYLVETLGRELARAGRHTYPACLVMADIDYFKRVNDAYGHMAGDAVLQALGRFLRDQCRAGDIVCRFGGEEFLIFMANINLEDALRRADAIRVEFGNFKTRYEGVELQVNLSMGIAAFPKHGEDRDELIRAADEALYRAKRTGRDQILAAP